MVHKIDLFDPRFVSPLDVLVKNFFDQDAVTYDKGEEKKSDSSRRFYHSGIKKSSFNFGWKVARRFELAKANAEMNNGLLIITVPYANESKPKSLKIK
jgi:HSP20 family molecular chaperone IbpA